MSSAFHRASRVAVVDILAPALFYFTAFVALTWPLSASFSTHFWADAGDGMQGVWNLWWFPKAVLDLGVDPWWTNYLHYPHGSTLMGHNLMEFDGMLAMALRGRLGLAATHNAVVVFSFVVSGLTTYWLALRVSGARLASGVAGFVFSFSSYHFAHAEGHLHIVSMEWLPLFVLVWLLLLDRPGAGRGALAACVLTLNLLCAPYFFLYGLMIAGILGWGWLRDGAGYAWLRRSDVRRAAAGFGGTLVATSGVWVGALLWVQIADPLLGAHSARSHSMDLLAPFVPGGHWRFAEWTRPYWSRVPSNIHESSVHLGWSVLGLLVLVWRARAGLALPLWRPWFRLVVIFALLSLGPGLFVWGFRLLPWGMPYAWLQLAFPWLKMAGVPVRMIVVTQLAAAVLVAVALSACLPRTLRARVAVAAILLLLAFEYWPKPLPQTPTTVPAYVEALGKLPGDGVLDLTAGHGHRGLYYQTVHEKRLVGGYLSRVPESVSQRTSAILEAAERADTAALCRQQIRYVVVDAGSDGQRSFAQAKLPERYRDARNSILEIECSADRREAPPGVVRDLR